MEKYFYPGPTEVQYLYDGTWSKGIAYRSKIIDLYNGQLISIDEVYAAALNMGISKDAAIIEKCEWINILEFMNS